MKIPLSVLTQVDILEAILPACQLYNEVDNHAGYKYVPDDNPRRNQRGFHESNTMHRILMGGNQSGKSRASAQEVMWWLTQTHPYQETPSAPKIWVVSASYTTIEEGVWGHLKDILPQWEIKRRGQIIPHTDIPSKLHLKNGAEVRFISAVGSNAARRKTQAAAIDLLVIDEEIEDVIFEELTVRRLARGAKTIVSATAVESVEWLLKMEERYEEGDSNVDLFRLDTREAAKVGHVDAEVLRDIEAMATEEEKQVRLEGKTRRRQGLIYPEFTPKHICSPFDIPKDWARYMAVDPGWNIFATLWVAVSPDSKMYVYRELYEHATTLDAIADKVYAAEGWKPNKAWDIAVEPDYSGKWLYDKENSEVITQRWIDPAEFGSNPGGGLKCGNLLANDHGLVCVPARNDVEYGIQMVKRAMVPGWDGVPRMQIFNTCTSFLRERSRYRRKSSVRYGRETDDRNPRPVKKSGHLMDCWRYVVSGGLDPATDEHPLLAEALSDNTCPMLMEENNLFHMRTQNNWDEIMSTLKQGPGLPEHDLGLGSEY